MRSMATCPILLRSGFFFFFTPILGGSVEQRFLKVINSGKQNMFCWEVSSIHFYHETEDQADLLVTWQDYLRGSPADQVSMISA